METCRTCAKCDFENGNNNYWLDLFHPTRLKSEMDQIRLEFFNWKLQVSRIHSLHVCMYVCMYEYITYYVKLHHMQFVKVSALHFNLSFDRATVAIPFDNDNDSSADNNKYRFEGR